MILKMLLAAAAALAVAGTTRAQTASIRTGGADIGSRPVSIYVTAKDTGQRLARIGDLHFTDLPQPTEKQMCIFVDPSKTFQTLLGIGGALTDASAETFFKLPVQTQKRILRDYYDVREGIGYSLARTHINSCDFSSDSYTYVQPGDTQLKSFSVEHDMKYRIPFIKQALAAAGGELTLYASPWSPPAWMKDNQDMLHGGELKPEFYDSWANYYVKFFEAYQKEGIPIWGLTVQNEPMAVQTWESCVYTASQERDFVRDHLGPIMAKNGLENKKILIWDHNRSMMYQRAAAVLDDAKAARYVWGVAFHWYVGDHFDNVKRVQEAYPKTHLLFSEGCFGPFDANQIHDWHWGELYGVSIINDLNNGAVGWTDWNVLLDQEGGPNHVGNYCFAPIHADTGTGELTYMNSYFYIGHFSKFLRPGARRIVSSSTSDDLLATAFVNSDNRIAVVVMNASAQAQPFYLWLGGKAASTSSPPHSIMTLAF
jgi:glucosylceramidase